MIGAIWILAGAPLPFAGATIPPPDPTSVPVIRTNLPDGPGRPTAPRIGQLAPDFEWQEPGGRVSRLADLRGRVVVLNFWATWCPPCKAEMPAMERVAGSDPGSYFLMVDLQEDQQQVLEFFERFGFRYLHPVIDPNGETARRYSLGALPQTYFIGPDSVIRHIEIGGPIDDARIEAGIGKARAH